MILGDGCQEKIQEGADANRLATRPGPGCFNKSALSVSHQVLVRDPQTDCKHFNDLDS